MVPKLETIEIALFEPGVAEIALNRPSFFNALNAQSYQDWYTAFKWAAESDAVKVVVLTGRGKYYTSGQELTGSENIKSVSAGIALTKNAVRAMIDFPKVLIVGVNGPALGFGVTTLTLCDVVYSVPHATFSTPFMKLGLCAEGCSSYTFPRIMGPSRANEMLFMGRTFTAKELSDCGFISRVLPVEQFREQVLAIAKETAKCSSAALAVTKKLIRGAGERQHLIDVNEAEIKAILKRAISKESLDAIKKFVEQTKSRRAVQTKSKI